MVAGNPGENGCGRREPGAPSGGRVSQS